MILADKIEKIFVAVAILGILLIMEAACPFPLIVLPATMSLSPRVFIFFFAVVFFALAMLALKRENKTGQSLTINDLAIKRITIIRKIDRNLLLVTAFGDPNGCNYRLLHIDGDVGCEIAVGDTIEITNYKKESFKDLDKNIFFLEENLVVKIITKGELEQEKAAKLIASTY